MSLNKTIKREFEVAFSNRSQALWIRIVKYAALAFMIYFFWESKTFWIILSTLFVFSLCLHFWVRHKTKGWTKSYGLWKYHDSKSVRKEE